MSKMTADSSRLLPEVLTSIFFFLDVRAKGRVALVCRSWRDAVYQRSLWRQVKIRWNDSWSIDALLLDSLARRGIRRVGAWAHEIRDLRAVARSIPGLESLELHIMKEVPHTADWNQVVFGMLEMSGMTELSLHYDTQKIDQCVKLITRHLKSLIVLKLKGLGRPSDDSLLLISTGLPHLKRLTLAIGQTLTDEGVGHLSGWKRNAGDVSAKLEHLSLSDFGFAAADRALLHLSRGQPNLQLLHIHPSDCVTDTGLSHLVQLTSLQDLQLRFCDRIGDDGFRHLAKLPSLRNLSVSYCDVSDVGLMHLADSGAGITNLTLYSCRNLTDDGMKQLARLATLQGLDVSYCAGITAEGLVNLSKGEARILKLVAGGCDRIGSDGLLRIAQSLHHMRTLVLEREQISEEGIALAARNLRRLHCLYAVTGGCPGPNLIEEIREIESGPENNT